LDHWKTFIRSSCGTPISSAIACSGSSQATWVTKSPAPLAAAASTIDLARADSSARRPLIARGVKPLEISLRSLVCSGASLLIRMWRCSSMASRGMSSLKRGIAVFS
jgi:hypothetical protein